jgi:hypothetical protein
MNAEANPRHSHLRLVPPPPPRPRRRYEVRIAVSAARTPVGRSRVFRLSENDIQLLVEAAMKLEARA